ncbi:hypothetical protein [Metamycoplasma hominis]|uniref:hypothetical protein n=1 Tax=Metamycoplasma hominis TaxID=2098 RepID=UPI003CE98216
MTKHENDLRINISKKAHIEALNSILSKSINEEINYYSIIVFVNKNKIYFRNDESNDKKKKLYFKEKIFLIYLEEILNTIYRCIIHKAKTKEK